MAEDLGEKTEEPTPKKLRDSREEGKVARSADLTSAIVLAGGSLAVWFGFDPFQNVGDDPGQVVRSGVSQKEDVAGSDRVAFPVGVHRFDVLLSERRVGLVGAAHRCPG